MKSVLASASVVLGIVTIVLYFQGRRHDAQIADLQTQVRSLATAETASASEDNSVLALRQTLFASMAEHRLPPPVSPNLPADAPTRREPTRHETHATKEEVRQTVQLAFESDVPDPQFSRRGAADARTKLESALPPGSKISSFECRSALCRMESSHANAAAFRQFAHALMDPATQVWNAPGMAFQTGAAGADGSVLTTEYLAREGHTLPALSQ